jgi:hypothetical protein
VNFVDSSTAGESAGATIVSQDPPDSNAPGLNGLVAVTFDRDLPTIASGFGPSAMQSTAVQDQVSKGMRPRKSPSTVASISPERKE